MSLPSYVVHAITGRARLRHPVFATPDGQKKALAVFAEEKKIRSVEQGRGSLLLFFDPSLNLQSVCRNLENVLPELTTNRPVKTGTPQTLEELFGISSRKLELRAMLSAFSLSSLLALLGSEKSHVATAALCVALMARHIWIRRRAM